MRRQWPSADGLRILGPVGVREARDLALGGGPGLRIHDLVQRLLGPRLPTPRELVQDVRDAVHPSAPAPARRATLTEAAAATPCKIADSHASGSRARRVRLTLSGDQLRPKVTGSSVPVQPDGIETRPARPVYLTPQELADMLQVDQRTVLRWAAEDPSMPTTRIGRVIRFEQAALFRWLDRKPARARLRNPERGAPTRGEGSTTHLEDSRPAHQAQSLGVRHRRDRERGPALQGGVDQGGRRERLGGAPPEARSGAEAEGAGPDARPSL